MEHLVKSSRPESTGRWQAASVRERFVFVRQQLFWLSLSYQMNNTSPETLSYITLCTYVCPYIYLLKFLMNNLFTCCFQITITPGDYRATCGQSHPWCGQLAPSAAGCVIFRPMDWWSRSGTIHRKYTGLPRRIDRNEYYFLLLYIVRQVTIPYSALQFRRNSPVFWCYEIPRT